MCDYAITGSLVSDVGNVRNINEDAIFFVASQTNSAGHELGALAVVADGMGGHLAGDVASRLATQVVRNVYFDSLKDSPPDALEKAFAAANITILEHAQAHPECAGMGTTCTAVAIKDGRMWLAHIGDSRAYLCSSGRIQKISDDQTLQAKMFREGLISQEDIDRGMHAHVILQALGSRHDIDPTILRDGIELSLGDQIIICTDGLTDTVSDNMISDVVANHTPQEACNLLLRSALESGGHDNVSIGILLVQRDEKLNVISQAETKKILLAASSSEN